MCDACLCRVHFFDWFATAALWAQQTVVWGWSIRMVRIHAISESMIIVAHDGARHGGVTRGKKEGRKCYGAVRCRQEILWTPTELPQPCTQTNHPAFFVVSSPMLCFLFLLDCIISPFTAMSLFWPGCSSSKKIDLFCKVHHDRLKNKKEILLTANPLLPEGQILPQIRTRRVAMTAGLMKPSVY
jgi:hypothetical protein